MAREGKLFSNTILLGIGAAAGKLLSLLLLPFFTAALTPAEFGICEVILSTALLLTPLFSLQAPQATFRFLAQGEEDAVRAGARLLTVGMLTLAALVPLLGRIAILRPYRTLLFCFVVASVFHSFASHILRARGNFLLFSLQQLFCALLTALLQLFFLRTWQLGVRGYLWGIVLGDAITSFILLFSIFPFCARAEKPKRALYADMLRFSLPLVPTALLWWGMSSADRYILLYFHGERATGLYAAAGRFPMLITFAASVFLEAWHYAALQGEGKTRAQRFGQIYALFLPAIVALGGVAIAFSPILVAVFLSNAYAEAARIVGLLLFGAICAGLASFLDSIYATQLHTGASLYTSVLATAVHLVLSFLLIPPFGAVGAAAAGALGFLALFLVRAAHTARLLKFPRHARALSCSLLLLFGAGLFLAGKYVFLGTVAALLAILPLFGRALDAFLFLSGRARTFLAGARKKQKYIEKDRKI